MTVLNFVSVLLFLCSTFAVAQGTTDTLAKVSLTSNPRHDTVSTKNDSAKINQSNEIKDTIPAPGDSMSASTQKAAPIIQEIEEELILDGDEESLIPTTANEKLQPVLPPKDSTKDSTVSTAKTTADTTNDSTARAQKNIQLYPISPIEQPPEKTIPLQIEKTQSINFAKNFKEYRSPKLAILLSLLVPGAGQAYAHNYLKTGIFGAVEVTLITFAAVLGYQGNKKLDKAREFADEHFSVEEFEKYYSNLSNHFSDTVLKQIFDPDSNASAFLSYSSNKSKDDNFYDYIRDPISPYIQGWDDAKPRFNSDFTIDNSNVENGHYVQDADSLYLVYFVNENDDSTESQYGFSEHQEEYNDKISESNNSYRWSKNFITFLLINHVASAVDAAITAKAHNDKLLGKSTVWQHINLRESVVNTPVGAANGLAIEVRF